MSTGEVRKVSTKDLQLVQNLIERCLQLYMSQKEVVSTLLEQAKIEPSFTELVWQKLEEENQEFFKAYHMRLMVKDQILKFNTLLQTQAELMRQICTNGAALVPTSNGSLFPTLHQNSAHRVSEYIGPAINSDKPRQPFGASSAFANDRSALHSSWETAIDISTQVRTNNVVTNTLPSQSLSMGMMQGLNGGLIKSEAGFASGSAFVFTADANMLESRSSIGETSLPSFNGVVDSNETIADASSSSFGFLGQIPRNFSLSDLTADFSISSDILESYSRSPFLVTDTGDFLDSHGRGDHQGDGKRLDTISEGLSYEGFGSD